jgi:predicted nucleic acid-binding protein
VDRHRLTLPDSSVWIEYLRATGSPSHLRLRELVRRGARIATTDVILMEVLAGAKERRHRDELQRLLYACEYLRMVTPSDFERAAEIYRVCRRNGETIRKLTDCAIAAVALRAEVPVLARDSDFHAIARHVPLELA